MQLKKKALIVASIAGLIAISAPVVLTGSAYAMGKKPADQTSSTNKSSCTGMSNSTGKTSCTGMSSSTGKTVCPGMSSSETETQSK